MLIIFDLDDTLIDTSGTLTPHRLRHMWDTLQHSGLPASFTWEQLVAAHQATPHTQEAVELFLHASPYKQHLYTVALQALYDPKIPLPPIATTPGALATLWTLSLHHTFALVTMGEPTYQRNKWLKAGIPIELFTHVIVSGSEGKGCHYHRLVARNVPQHVWVCGDVVNRDLDPAYALGCTTVWLRWGRSKGARIEGEQGSVDYVIDALPQLVDLMNEDVVCTHNR